MQKRLTTKSIDALPAAKRKRYEVRDTLLPGFHLRVATTGGKVFYVSKRVDGRMKRIKIGAYPIVSLQEARERARTLLRDIELGIGAPGTTVQPVPTFGEIVPQFIDLYARPRTKDWKGTESVLRKFARFDAMPIHAIKRGDVVRVLDDMIGDGAPMRANRALAAIKKLMNWCVDRGVIDTSPVAALRPPTKEVARERVLNDAEVASVWNAAEAEGFPFAQFVHMLILTGQRRGEVAGMRWSEIDLDNATWTIPSKRVKNATTHIVPLAPLALLTLRSIPRFSGSDFVFTTTGNSPISGFGRLKERLDAALSGAEDWRLHDFRRTMATKMAMMGVQPHIIEAVLNHKSGVVSGVAAVYNRHAYVDEKRDALERWERHVENNKESPCRAEAATKALARASCQSSADIDHSSVSAPR